MAVIRGGDAETDLESTKRFLTALDEEAEAFTFQTFADHEDAGDELRRELARVLHGPLDSVAPALRRMNARGAGIYVMVNAGDLEGRSADNVVGVRALFADFDGTPLPAAWPLEPHMVIESSPGKWHAYWLASGIELAEFKPFQKTIAKRFGTDPKVQDLPRVMRLPGFFHRKGAPFLSRIAHQTPSQPYSREALVAAFDLHAPDAEPERAAPTVPGATIGKGQRNDRLFKLACAMRAHGATEAAILDALTADNLARCSPPLSEADVRTVAAQAAKYAPGGQAEAPTADPAEWPAALDLATMAATEPTAPQHIVPDWMPAGEVTLLGGHGGAGKSACALHLGVCIALGLPWHGLKVERRRVLYISAEDNRKVLHWRLSRIAAHLGVSINDIADLELVDSSAMDAELMIETGDDPILTGMYEALAARMGDTQVLILDGASDLYGASEITRRHVRKFLRAVRRLIPEDGAALLLAHVDKAAARGKESTDHYSGSTAWNNSVRSRWALKPEGQDEKEQMVLRLEKANYAAAGAEIRLRWNPEAHMHLADENAAGGVVAAIRERQEREGIVAALRACTAAGIVVPAATTGRRTALHVLAAQPAFPASLKGETASARRHFWAVLEQLRAMGTVRESSIRRADRHYVAALELSPEALRACGE